MRLAILLATALTCCVPATAQQWQQAPAESQGYLTPRLEALRAWLKVQDTTSTMVVVHGKVIFQYGDLTHPSKIASCRKSILGMLYANYIGKQIDLGKTVVQLGLEEPGKPFPP